MQKYEQAGKIFKSFAPAPLRQSTRRLKKKDSLLSFQRQWKGSIEFPKSLELQKKWKAGAKKGEGVFLGFESKKPVITLGFRSDKNHILWPEKKLKESNISQMEIHRGGEATLHSPGQLVIYPILSLPKLGLKVKDFISVLENITQSVLEDFGISTQKEGKYAGLYTKTGKICFFGIHISEGVSQHGLSVNIDNDLNLFGSIKSCGEPKRKHDRLSLYQSFFISKEQLFLKWCDKAEDVFKSTRSKSSVILKTET